MPRDYRRPEHLPAGGVLVVGASSTGVQLADEIQRSGRQVTLAVGRHTRLPRRYRGRDILWWLDELGMLRQEAASVHDLARLAPSAVAATGRRTDSHIARSRGAARSRRAAGRPAPSRRWLRVSLADDLIATTAAADIKMADLLGRIDRSYRRESHRRRAARAVQTDLAICCGDAGRSRSAREGIRTVIWATGLPARVSMAAACPCSTRAAKSCTSAGRLREPGSTCSA